MLREIQSVIWLYGYKKNEYSNLIVRFIIDTDENTNKNAAGGGWRPEIAGMNSTITKQGGRGVMNKNRIKVIALVLAMIFVSGLIFGCGDKQTVTPPVPEGPAVISIEEVADKFLSTNPDNNRVIPEEKLKERIDANDDSLFIIDIRSPEDYAAGHIKGAVNAPFTKLHDYIDQFPVDKELVVYCKSGQTAGQTIAILNMYGYNASSLNLGFDNGWVKKNNFPADTEAHVIPAGLTPAQPDPAIAAILKDYFATMPNDTNIIEVADALARIEGEEEVQIIDMRKPEDFAQGHVEGAINIPFGQLGKNLDKINVSKPVIIYCYSGQMGGQAVAVLKVLGYQAHSIKGGYNFGWTAGNMPVIKEAA